MKKISNVVLIIAMSLFILTGCGNETLDGTWVGVKWVDSEGNSEKIKPSEATETFVFNGDTAVQTVKTGGKDITIPHTVEKISDTEYKLIANDKIEYATLIIKGNQFYFRIETKIDSEAIAAMKIIQPDFDTSHLESMPEYTDYYFEKVK